MLLFKESVKGFFLCLARYTKAQRLHWIGLYRPAGQSEWTTWQDGSMYDVNNVPWCTCDTKVKTSEQACVRLIHPEHKQNLADGKCSEKDPFICEQDGNAHCYSPVFHHFQPSI